MEPRRREPDGLVEEAQKCIQELATADINRLQAFIRWTRCSPERLLAYLRLSSLESEIGGIEGSVLTAAMSELLVFGLQKYHWEAMIPHHFVLTTDIG